MLKTLEWIWSVFIIAIICLVIAFGAWNSNFVQESYKKYYPKQYWTEQVDSIAYSITEIEQNIKILDKMIINNLLEAKKIKVSAPIEAMQLSELTDNDAVFNKTLDLLLEEMDHLFKENETYKKNIKHEEIVLEQKKQDLLKAKNELAKY
jgi:hypothetical protein